MINLLYFVFGIMLYPVLKIFMHYRIWYKYYKINKNNTNNLNINWNDSRDMLDVCIKVFNIEIDNFFVYDNRSINGVMYNEDYNIFGDFAMEIYPLLIKLKSANMDKGDTVPIFLINKNLKQVMRLTIKENAICNLELFYKYCNIWTYKKIEKNFID